ncbi:MAG: hypothetical protein LBL81_01295 [Tannerella sp.]|jgi:hypothetical protein|nr:hypothetical protein [Tannerella sp.]
MPAKKKNEQFKYEAGGIERFAESYHPSLENCVKRLDDMLKQEGYTKQNAFKNETALNLDEAETALSTRKKNKSMTVDWVIFLNKGHLLLSEAKFHIKNARNVDEGFFHEIERKVSSSKSIILKEDNFLNLHIEKTTVVLFQEEIVEQCVNRFRRFAAGKPEPELKPSNVEDFYQNYFT